MKRIFNTLSQKWPKYLLEILVITIGVLGAFSLSNWNEHRKEGQQKVQMLEALTHDFEKNQVLLAVTREQHTKVHTGAIAAMKIVTMGDQEVPEDSLIELLISARQNDTFDAVNGALRAAISSGGIHFIENEELSVLLFQWEDFVDDINEDELIAREYARSKINLQNKYIRERMLLFSTDFDAGKSAHQSEIRSLYRDPMFEDYFTSRYRGSRHILGGYDQLESMCQEILLLLNQESEN